MTDLSIPNSVRASLGLARTARAKQLFLAEFGRTLSVTQGAKQAGIARRTHYDWLANDETYRAAFAEANQEVTDRIEAEIFRRGHDGVERDVYWQGKVVGQEREYSDRLLELLAKARRPEVYRERHEITGAGGGPIEVSSPAVDHMIEELLGRRHARLEEAG